MHMSQDSGPRVTMADIAREVGCNPSTVSLALRGHPSIPERTSARIRRVAERIGYVRHAAFEVLAQQRWQRKEAPEQAVLALVEDPIAENNSYRMRFHEQLLQAGRKAGYRIDRFFCASRAEARKLNRVLIHRGIEGVILGETLSSPEVPEFDWKRFSVVALQSERPRVPFHQVTYDYFDGARLATRKAIEAGRHRIGLVVLTHGAGERDYAHVGGFLAEMRLGAQGLRPLVKLCPFNRSKEIPAWIRRHKIEVVIGSTESLLVQLRLADLKCPEDIWFISLREAESAGVACIARNQADVAEATISLLHSELKLNHKGIPKHPLRISILPDWQGGESLPAPPDPQPHEVTDISSR